VDRDLGGAAGHYGTAGLIERIRQGLAAAGKDLAALSLADLAPIDSFHVRGNAATEDLLFHFTLGPGAKALDIGCGTGGTSRMLAASFGCDAVGIDLTPEYVDVARTLSEWVGLTERTRFEVADATRLPFEDATFHAAVTQHVGMNIADKTQLYGEAARVLQPGCMFGIYDVLQGGNGQIRYPVPWARDPSISFPISAEAMRQHLTDAGFNTLNWRDCTAAGIQFIDQTLAKLRTKTPPLGLHLLLGDDFLDLLENLGANLREGRAMLAEIITVKRP